MTILAVVYIESFEKTMQYIDASHYCYTPKMYTLTKCGYILLHGIWEMCIGKFPYLLTWGKFQDGHHSAILDPNPKKCPGCIFPV